MPPKGVHPPSPPQTDAEGSPRRSRTTEYLAEFTRTLAQVAVQLEQTTTAALSGPKAKVVPELEAAVRRRLTKLPEDLLLIEKALWLTDPRFVGEPLLWPLAAEEAELELLVHNTILGAAGQIWKETARTMWTPKRMSASDSEYVAGQLRELERFFRAGLRALYRFPVNEPKEVFLIENYDDEEGPLWRAACAVKELQGKMISITLGPGAAKDFFVAWRLQHMANRAGGTARVAIEKIRMRSAATSDKRPRDEQQHQGRGRGGGRGGGRGRGGKDRVQKSRDPAVFGPKNQPTADSSDSD